MTDERFSLWLSMAATDRTIRDRLLPGLGRAGYWNAIGARAGFTGARIGRGAGVGRVLAARTAPSRRSVATDTRVVRLQRGYPSSAVRDHLRYLTRASMDAERRPALYDADFDRANAVAFARTCQEDRHQFRTVVGAKDAAEYEDLRPLVRRLMAQAARDLRTDLDWVAADHYDTAHPHSHIVLRGVDDRGQDLVIAREYINHGLKERAAELVALDLGPEQNQERSPSRERHRDILLERATPLDRDLVAMRDHQGLVRPEHIDKWEQAARMGRLRILESMGLAQADHKGRWYIQPDLVERLDEIAWRNRMARSPTREDREHDLATSVDGLGSGDLGRPQVRGGAERTILLDGEVDPHLGHLDLPGQEPDRSQVEPELGRERDAGMEAGLVAWPTADRRADDRGLSIGAIIRQQMGAQHEQD